MKYIFLCFVLCFLQNNPTLVRALIKLKIIRNNNILLTNETISIHYLNSSFNNGNYTF